VSLITLARFQDAEIDPALPTLARAIDPRSVQEAFARSLPWDATLRSIRISTYKPGRRCLIEYEVDAQTADGHSEPMSLLGKIRAHRFGKSGYRQLKHIWNAGFAADSADGISVPEPVATVSPMQMWLQRKVDGRVATGMLLGLEGRAVARRIAEAVHKLHQATIPAERRHTIHDELSILRRCLAEVAASDPRLARQVARLRDACERLGSTLPEPAWCGSHRDFYSDQVLVAGQRLFLIDFDLYCEADPGLDIGNFIGHVTELSLRTHADPDVLAPIERELEDRFVTLAGESTRWAVRVYAALTLARHVFLSTRFADRRRLTPALVALATTRVLNLAAEGGHA
jgi:hypothetical protein